MDDFDTHGCLEASIDTLAALEHERWSHWQRYVHQKAEKRPDGSLLIPADLVHHWETQIQTEFSDLSEQEKESDREQVRKYIPAVTRILQQG